MPSGVEQIVSTATAVLPTRNPSSVVVTPTLAQEPAMPTYKLKHSHGITEKFESYEDAVAAVKSVYGDDAEIGHDGDIPDGGQRTLCWQDAATAIDSDGSRACCEIIQVFAAHE